MKHKLIQWMGILVMGAGLYSCSGGGPMGASSGRPGLATGWGEEKSSRVYDREFRRSSSVPVGTDVVYYNDMEGIRAMAGRVSRVEGMQSAAGGMVMWGIKSGGRMLNTYKERGDGRRLVAGDEGAAYSICLRNCTGRTLEIVASVDGLDVQDGKPASYAKRGYLIDAGGELEIDGFRTSQHAVAAFRFSGVANSYANLKHGDTRNVGVMGIAVFTRKGENPWSWPSNESQVRGQARAFAEAPAGL